MHMSVGAEIRRVRVNAGLTIVAFAARLGVNPSTVVRWEQGSTEPRLNALRDIAALGGRTVDGMLGGLGATDAH